MSVARKGFSARKPISIWNRPLQADFKDLFRSLSKTTIHAISGHWDKAARDAIDMVSAVGLNQDVGQLAWLLIRRSLAKALYDLVEEHEELLKRTPDDLEALCNDLDLSLEQAELLIDHHFFEQPGELALLEMIRTPFAEWLQGFGLPESQATHIAARLRPYFVFTLNEEWRRYAKDYVELKEIDTPFTRASEREQQWCNYNAWLKKQIDEPIFYEAFSLHQIYIPLRAYYENGKQDISYDQFDNVKECIDHNERVVVELGSELDDWLYRSDSRDTIKVICGGPGCGKTAFTKIFAARHAQRGGARVLFIPLHRFDPSKDLIDAVGDFIRHEGFFTYNPLAEMGLRGQLLIIFDGLDELAMQGKVAEQLSQQFVREVRQQTDFFNARESRLKVLISGREPVVQANDFEFRKPGQILHVLPYYLEENTRKIYRDPQEILNDDQRQSWWKKYGG